MAKINVLDSSIFNLISAGEVVDKPMSVVKELVENSIDAGATNIEIEVKNGGIDYIRVTDNGCGIEKSEIRKAFMPHATSKINCVEDLNSILTLGFRGEALASIAAVANVTLTSKVKDAELGNAVRYESGTLVSEHEVGAPDGTSIVVENIFEKIPARQKYLRSPSSEEADIANLVTRLILSNPNISFKCTLGTKKIQSTGEGEKSALIAVYGNKILSDMTEVSLTMPDITIKGFIGKPSYSKHSRNYQTLIVNGRYVKNDEISYMMFLCYKDYLMSRRYPTYVLYIDVPADMVDVNVHPSKMEVKFVQIERIKKEIKRLVSDKLNELSRVPKEVTRFESDDSKFFVDDCAVKQTNESEAKTFNKSENPPEIVKFDFSLSGIKSVLNESPSRLSDYESDILNNGLYNVADKKELDCDFDDKTIDSLRSNNEKGFLSDENYEESVSDFLGESEVLTVGTLFSTYIIVEQGENCYLIDQHAAHERILYDKFVSNLNNGTLVVQKLLVPYTFDLSCDESKLLSDNLALFESCGFEIENCGNDNFAIHTVPSEVVNMSFSKFLPMFFDAIKLNDLNKSSLIKDVLAQTACKAAVKGDRLLSMGEIKHLISGVDTLSALLCPHGRPIAVKLTKLEVDKWFKRK